VFEPLLRLIITGIDVDSGVAGDFITNAKDGVTVRAELALAEAPPGTPLKLNPGDKIIYSTDRINWIDITDSLNGTHIEYFDSSLTSTKTVYMRIEGAGGGRGPQTGQLITIDTTAPAETVTIHDAFTVVGLGSLGPSPAPAPSVDIRFTGTLSAPLADGSKVGVSAESVQVSLDGGKTWHNASVSGTEWQYIAELPNTDSVTLQARVVDVAGNAGAVTKQDVSHNETRSIITIDSVSPDTGASASDFITNSWEFKFYGKLGSPLGDGQEVQISLDGGQNWLDATVNGTEWYFQVAIAFSGPYSPDSDSRPSIDGAYAVQARVVDSTGTQVGSVATQTMVVDTTAPTEIVTINNGLGYVLDLDGTGWSGAVTGTLSAPLADGSKVGVSAESVQVSLDGGKTWHDAIVNGTSWSYFYTSPPSGNSIAQARVVDLAGNVGAVVTQQFIAIDSISPDSGASSSDFITSTTLGGGEGGLTFTGTLGHPLIQNSSITQFVRIEITDAAGNNMTWGASATLNGTTWTYTPPNTLPDGTYTVQATILERMTPTSEGLRTYSSLVIAQTTQTVVVDTHAPTEVVTIDNLALLFQTLEAMSIDSTGPIFDSFPPSYPRPVAVISGTLSSALADGSQSGVSAESLQISLDGGQTWNNAAVNGSTWTYSLYGLPSGFNLTVEARVVDAAGNAGPVVTQHFGNNAPLTITIDSISPDTGASSSDFITNDGGLILHGTLSSPLAAGQNLQISMDGGKSWWVTKYGDYSAHDTQWTFDYSAALTIFNGEKSTPPDGTYAVQARIIDNSGATVSSVATHTVVVDTTAPAETLTINNGGIDHLVYVFDRTGGGISYAVTGTLSAALADGSQNGVSAESVQVSLDGGKTWHDATVDGTSWLYSFTSLPSGDFLAQARIVDLAGNVGAVAMQQRLITIDTISPDSGASASDFITSTTLEGGQGGLTFTGTLGRPLITDSGTTEDVRVEIRDAAGHLISQVPVTVDGVTWTYVPPDTLPDGTYTVQAQIVRGPIPGPDGLTPLYIMTIGQTTQTVVVDNTAPTEIVTIDNGLWYVIAFDGSVSSGYAVAGTLSAALADGSQNGVSAESVQVSLDGGQTWHDATVDGTSWSYSFTSLPSGVFPLLAQARIVDLAGNVGAVATQQPLVFEDPSGGLPHVIFDGLPQGAEADQWQVTGTTTVDGVLYDVYHNATQGASTVADLLIQHGISVI